jgi:hypothetical protein
MHRKKRLMPDASTREFLRAQNVAHVGTVDAKGWPYAGLVYFHLLLHGLSLAGAFESAPEQAPMRPEPVLLVR